MNPILRFLKDWTLPISMLMGALLYFAVDALRLPSEVNDLTFDILSHWIQPMLIFLMLYFSFSKVEPHDMRPHRWQMWVLLVQMSIFVFFSLTAFACEQWLGCSAETKILLEGAMLCFVCPTATASAVITGKLGGSISDVATYLIMCNSVVALLAPVFLTLVEPHGGMGFVTSLFMIMGKVFPLLICPLLAAWITRFLFPDFHKKIIGISGVAFYLWAFGLAFAITVTVRSIALSSVDISLLVGLAAIALVCCVFQFAVGKAIGSRYDTQRSHLHRITAGQAFGQKNTVFAIWLGLVFLDPVTSVVGGFYSVWHNIINSWQLYKVRKG